MLHLLSPAQVRVRAARAVRARLRRATAPVPFIAAGAALVLLLGVVALILAAAPGWLGYDLRVSADGAGLDPAVVTPRRTPDAVQEVATGEVLRVPYGEALLLATSTPARRAALVGGPGVVLALALAAGAVSRRWPAPRLTVLPQTAPVHRSRFPRSIEPTGGHRRRGAATLRLAPLQGVAALVTVLVAAGLLVRRLRGRPAAPR